MPPKQEAREQEARDLLRIDRAIDSDRFFTAKSPWPSVKFRHPLNRKFQRMSDIFFRRNNVADGKIEQIAGANL